MLQQWPLLRQLLKQQLKLSMLKKGKSFLKKLKKLRRMPSNLRLQLLLLFKKKNMIDW